MRVQSIIFLLGASLSVAATFAADALASPPVSPVTLALTVRADDMVQARYTLARPVRGLHFAQQLGGYRAQDWHPEQPGFRLVSEGDGERIERTDGAAFDRLSFTIPKRYRALPKSYAPFAPFSDGSALIHSGQFHACPAAPCKGVGPLPITIAAPGATIGVGGRRTPDRAAFVSREEGTNIFVGSLAPVSANGFVAIIDPGLPVEARDHLVRSLPRAMDDFAALYGRLSFRPELYVSIDARHRADGNISTQGGTLPRQIFMHFDGEGARDRAAKGTPYWLDWFFAHEAAHLFQQDKVGKLAGDDAVAWIHEGGADAMAALDLARRGAEERRYVEQRIGDARRACGAGLAEMPLGQATRRGKFDLHYQCGLLIWLALDGTLQRGKRGDLHSLNRAFFGRVRGGAAWSRSSFFAAARRQSVPAALIEQIKQLDDGGYGDSQAAVEAIIKLAAPLPGARG